MPAWSEPRTWLPLEEQTSAVWNQHVRDNLLALRWGPWQTFAAAGIGYGSGFADYGGSYAPGRVRVTGDGRNVELRGLLSTTGVGGGGTILSIPVALRPAVNEIRQIIAGDSFWRADLNAAGTLTSNLALGASWLTLAGVTWATD